MSTEDDEPSERDGVVVAQPGGARSDVERIQDGHEGHQGQDTAEDQDGGSYGASRAVSSGRDLVVVERRRPAATTDMTPCQSALEPTSREGLFLWAETTKVPPGWTFLGATADNRVVIYDAIRDFLETYNICVHRVPTSGNGAIEASAKSIAAKLL